MNTRLSREAFREGVFSRDSGICVVPGCQEEAQDAHHIIDRSLWVEEEEKEGYFLDNGVSVCGEHHRQAEKNNIPPAAFWYWIKVEPHLPKGWEPGIYNKWGDRIKDPTDQNEEHSRYPSTPYMGISPTVDSNSEVTDLSRLWGNPLVLTVKMDGSNISLTRDVVTARNGTHAIHPSFSPLKALHQQFRHQIPEDLRLCGEWLWARHSIHYQGELALRDYLQIFGVFHMGYRMFLSWQETEDVCTGLGLTLVPVVATYSSTEAPWKVLLEVSKEADEVIKKGQEGVVLRSQNPFYWGEFGLYTAKYVRPNHVQTDKHWSKQKVVKNERRVP